MSYCSLSATKLSAGSTIGHMSGVQCYMSVSGGGVGTGEAGGLGGEGFGTGEGARENRCTGG